MEEKFCDQKECPLYPYPNEDEAKIADHEQVLQEQLVLAGLKEPSEEVANKYNSINISWDNLTINGNLYSNIQTPKSIFETKIESLDIPVRVECLVCSHFKKCDMSVILRVLEARKVLEGK